MTIVFKLIISLIVRDYCRIIVIFHIKFSPCRERKKKTHVSSAIADRWKWTRHQFSRELSSGNNSSSNISFFILHGVQPQLDSNSSARADFMDPLTLPCRAFHLTLPAKPRVSTLVTCLENKGRSERDGIIDAQEQLTETERGRKVEIEETDGRYGWVAELIGRYFSEITISTRTFDVEISRVQNESPAYVAI